MKYNIGDFLYYVSPFVFTIEKIKVHYTYTSEKDEVYYIDQEGAYLLEEDLFDNLEYAINHAVHLLNKFYNKRMQEIIKTKDLPLLNEGDIWS